MKKYRVIIPTIGKRIEKVENIYMVSTKEEADELVSWLEKNGMVKTQPAYERVVEIIESETIETLIDETTIEEDEED